MFEASYLYIFYLDLNSQQIIYNVAKNLSEWMNDTGVKESKQAAIDRVIFSTVYINNDHKVLHSISVRGKVIEVLSSVFSKIAVSRAVCLRGRGRHEAARRNMEQAGR